MRGQRGRLPSLVLGVGSLLLLAVSLVQPQLAFGAINQQIGFQGKLTNPNGTNVTDGTYSIRFRIYNHVTNDAANACAANSCLWEETQGSVNVTDGIFQVALGSGTALPGSVDFNSSPLYLGVKVGSDAEMTPRIQFTAAPYAFNADRVGGIAASGLVQLSPGSQQSGFINVSGNITSGGTYNTNTFTGSSLQFGSAATASIQSASGQALNITGNAASTFSTSSGNLTIQAGSGTVSLGSSTTLTANGAIAVQSGGTGTLTLATNAQSAASTNSANVVIASGNASGTTSTAGNITLDVGTSTTSNGSILIGTAARAQTITLGNATGGAIRVGQNGGTVQIDGTNIDVSTAGVITVAGGQASDITTAGAAAASAITIQPGTSTGASSNGPALTVRAGDGSGTTSVTGGALTLQAGSATAASGTRNGGSVILDAGTGATANGTISIGTANAAAISLSKSGVNITSNGNLIAAGAATATTATTTGTGTDTTTVTLAAGAFANGDVIFVDNAGQDYYTRITAGGGTTSLTVSPAVTFETGRTVTKYTIQNIGATSTDYTTLADRFYQGYFLGGIVTGAASTIYSDANISSANGLRIAAASSVIVKNTVDSTSEFQIQKANAATLFTADSTNNEVSVGSGTTDTTQVLLQLDSFSTRADTATCTTTNNQGAIYYNTNSHSIRGCINGGWEDLISTAGLGILLFGVVADSGTNPGDLPALVTTGVSGPCKVSRGGAQNQFSISPCIAYSNGRKVVVAQQTNVTITGLTTTNIWAHICLNGTDDQPVLSAAAATENATTNLPTWNAANPILCLADIRGSATVANNIAQIYDVRTFTNSQKEFVTNTGTQLALGQIAIISGTHATVAGTGGLLNTVMGVVSATTTASTTTPSAIITTYGPTYAKASAGTAGQFASSSTATAGYILSTGTSATSNLGLVRTTFNATCTTAATCLGSLYLNFKSR